jgi:hypothetical protein
MSLGSAPGQGSFAKFATVLKEMRKVPVIVFHTLGRILTSRLARARNNRTSTKQNVEETGF